MSECEFCWNTGYFRGMGGPCKEGCQPPNKKRGLSAVTNPDAADPAVVDPVEEDVYSSKAFADGWNATKPISDNPAKERLGGVVPSGTLSLAIYIGSKEKRVLEVHIDQKKIKGISITMPRTSHITTALRLTTPDFFSDFAIGTPVRPVHQFVAEHEPRVLAFCQDIFAKTPLSRDDTNMVSLSLVSHMAEMAKDKGLLS